jgi:hypothetical protein
VDREGVEEVTDALTRLSDDAALRTALAAWAGALAIQRHDEPTVRRAFQASVIAAAETSILRGTE